MHPGFLYYWRRAQRHAQHAHHAHQEYPCGHQDDDGPGDKAFVGPRHHAGGPRGGGGPFGARRPLRVMVQQLELDDDQTEIVARVIDDLKTERAQAAVHERRSVGQLADALLGDEFDETAVRNALQLRVQAAEQLRDAVLHALSQTHAALTPEQRKRLSYLLRSGTLTI